MIVKSSLTSSKRKKASKASTAVRHLMKTKAMAKSMRASRSRNSQTTRTSSSKRMTHISLNRLRTKVSAITQFERPSSASTTETSASHST
jgi:hypothetical protein